MRVELVEAPILKAVAKSDGDGWKDTRKKGDVVYVYNYELLPPYAPGQYQRVGELSWTVSAEDYDLTPATPREVFLLFVGVVDKLDPESKVANETLRRVLFPNQQ